METNATASGMGVRFFFRILLKHGYTLSQIEDETGITRSILDDPASRISIENVMNLADLSFRVSNDPALGIHIAENNQKSPFHFITHIAISSENMLEAFQYWSKYAQLDSDLNKVEIRREEGSYIVQYANTSHYQAVWVQELYLSQAILACRAYVDPSVNPLEVRFVHLRPDYYREYAALFKAPVFFAQQENALVMSQADMLRTIPSRNPHLKTALIEHANLLLEKRKEQTSVEETTRKLIIQALAGKVFNITAISRQMSMDRTTLHRKLKREGTTFSQLLERIRRELATNYLHQGIHVNEISYLLGFSEPSAFQHAFKRWFGTSPGRFRKEE